MTKEFEKLLKEYSPEYKYYVKYRLKGGDYETFEGSSETLEGAINYVLECRKEDASVRTEEPEEFDYYDYYIAEFIDDEFSIKYYVDENGEIL